MAKRKDRFVVGDKDCITIFGMNVMDSIDTLELNNAMVDAKANDLLIYKLVLYKPNGKKKI